MDSLGKEPAMNRCILDVAVLILSIFSAPRSLPVDPLEAQNQAIPHAERESAQPIAAQVDAYLKPYADMQDFSGAVLIARGSRVLVNKAYGMANCELAVTNTPQTRFRIASVSKQFTAAAVLLQEQRKLLSTDDPLAKFVPDLPHGEEITIHHLLTHTSGITGSMENLPGSNRTCRHFILWLSWHKCLRSRCWNCRQDRELHTRTRIMFCWHTLSKRSAANTSDRSCGTTSWRR